MGRFDRYLRRYARAALDVHKNAENLRLEEILRHACEAAQIVRMHAEESNSADEDTHPILVLYASVIDTKVGRFTAPLTGDPVRHALDEVREIAKMGGD